MAWRTATTLDVDGVTPAEVWRAAYADPRDWPRWNDELASATLDGPLREGAVARVRFRTGLRLRFVLVEVEAERLFTDESRLPGARMGHRHELASTEGGVRLTNTIYIEGPLAALWARVLGPRAHRGLPDWQRKAADLARQGGQTP